MSEWVSVKDRLPDNDTSVLVVFVWLGKKPVVRQMTFYTEDYWHRPNMFVAPDGGHHELKTITHWQSLPELPKN